MRRDIFSYLMGDKLWCRGVWGQCGVRVITIHNQSALTNIWYYDILDTVKHKDTAYYPWEICIDIKTVYIF